MVSQLSSRILNIDSPNSHYRFCARVMSPDSGYAADKESGYSSGISSSVSKTPQQTTTRAPKTVGTKKRKMDELHYLAATARSSCVAPRLSKKSYKRSLAGINRDSVELVTVSRRNPYEDDIQPSKNLDVFDLSIYSEMVQSSKQFYSINGLSSLPNDMINSIPNPLISSDSNDTKPHEIPARFQDYNQNENNTEDECEEIEISEKNILKDAILRSVICSSSLDKVFSTQSSARLLTEPEQPYIILHANAAFLKLSGIPSNKLIGRPLNTIMTVPVTPSKSSLCHISNDSVLVSLKDIDETNNKQSSKSSNITTYELKTTKVCSGTRMTHLSLDVEKRTGVDTYDTFIAMTG